MVTPVPASLLAHADAPVEPHDLWASWGLHPLTVLALAGLAWCYRRGGRPAVTAGRGGRRTRAMAFWSALAVLALALVTPLDALSGALASAHMVQHVLLVLVAAPLLAWSAPLGRLVRGVPVGLRPTVVGWRRRLAAAPALHAVRHPVAAWLAHVVALWFWHASGPYDAAVGHEPLHLLEHATFVGTGVLFWSAVLARRTAGGAPTAEWLALVLVFTMALQGVFLSALITFAPTAWYASYRDSTEPWGLTPLDDQQLAGAIMWIPAGMVYVGIGLALVVAWLRRAERLDEAQGSRPAAPGTAAAMTPSPPPAP